MPRLRITSLGLEPTAGAERGEQKLHALDVALDGALDLLLHAESGRCLLRRAGRAHDALAFRLAVLARRAGFADAAGAAAAAACASAAGDGPFRFKGVLGRLVRGGPA